MFCQSMDCTAPFFQSTDNSKGPKNAEVWLKKHMKLYRLNFYRSVETGLRALHEPESDVTDLIPLWRIKPFLFSRVALL